MARWRHRFDDEKIYELILADQQAIAALYQDIERLNLFLELRSLRPSTTFQLLKEYLRWSDDAFGMVETKRKNLRAEVDAMAEAQREGKRPRARE